jgi:hypothetical protein
MFDIHLFLGFVLDARFLERLDAVNSKKRELFVQNGNSAYLQIASYQNRSYLGKFIGEIMRVEELYLMEKNIYTLVCKLVPSYPYADIPLILLPIYNDQRLD